ncbi:MAG: homocysteine S-methyltransferase family protein, partial [Pseudonocardiaceae bacterium]
MTHPLLERLAAGPILADGAIGTVLYAAGASLDESFDALNLTRPDLVLDVHRAYLEAGADLIETNSFGANRFKLDGFGLGGKVREINKKAVRLAREAREISGRSVLVAGSVGPTGRTLAPIGMVSPEAVRAAFREQIEALLEGGVDLLVLETIGSLDEMTEAVAAAREASDLPIVASMTFAEDGRTIGGNAPEEVAARLSALGVAAIGANCSVGPQRLLPVAEALVRRLEDESGPVPAVSCMPNAGWPAHVAGRVIYPSSPEYFAGFARRAVEAGVRIIGGCCGTTPLHTAAMREALDSSAAGRQDVTTTRPEATVAPRRRTRILTAPELDLTPAEGPTRLREKLDRGEFVVSVEIDPPKGLNPTKAIDGA